MWYNSEHTCMPAALSAFAYHSVLNGMDLNKKLLPGPKTTTP